MIPVIEALAGTVAVPISVDTTKAAVADAALRAGAAIVNDVSAGTADPEMLSVVGAAGAGYVAMHMQGGPRTMQTNPHYDDVVGEVATFLGERRDAARAAGVPDDALMVDPGIGFGKTLEHNLELLASLPELIAAVGVPVLVGTSRKAFLGRIIDEADPAARDDATLATVVWALERGASMVRVHDVRAAVQAAAVLGAMARASVGAPRDGGDHMTTLRGRWAQGLEPRMFCWIVKDRLAASERPGGFARNHRKIRRQEELIWLAQQGFTRVVSLLDSPHNLHAYGEAGIACEHVPLGRHDELTDRLPVIYESLARRLDSPEERILLHHEEFGDRLIGVLAGYLIYAGLVDEGPHATLLIERLTNRELGAVGREIVAITIQDGIVRRPR